MSNGKYYYCPINQLASSLSVRLVSLNSYDPKENKWSKVASMNTRRLGVAVAVLGGYLYAVGGSDGQMPLNTGTHGRFLFSARLFYRRIKSNSVFCLSVFVWTVERYDPRQNKWTLVAPMSTRRKHLGCAVYNNWIYAVGGRDDATELSSAERYNPHTNIWSPIVAMSSRRSGVSLLFTAFDRSNANEALD